MCLVQLSVQCPYIQLRFDHSHTPKPLIPQGCSYGPKVMHQSISHLNCTTPWV